ncbi:GNAT family N-acetyltransferase [Lentilactobacillus parafarraginis]|nr:N-acetyltransferase [Lentilactobacillus parafarraginis]
MIIRTVRQADYSPISDLLMTTFSKSQNGYGGEAALVERIRKDPTYKRRFEIVADQAGRLVGYGLLSNVIIENENQSKTGLCLAPMAVIASHQRQGIGKQIVTELEHRAALAKFPFISVLGWPDYYGKLGYQRASQFGIKPPFPAPDDTYMIKAIIPNGLSGVQGTVHYLRAFGM